MRNCCEFNNSKIVSSQYDNRFCLLSGIHPLVLMENQKETAHILWNPRQHLMYLEKTVNMTHTSRFKLTMLGRFKLTTVGRSKLTTEAEQSSC